MSALMQMSPAREARERAEAERWAGIMEACERQAHAASPDTQKAVRRVRRRDASVEGERRTDQVKPGDLVLYRMSAHNEASVALIAATAVQGRGTERRIIGHRVDDQGRVVSEFEMTVYPARVVSVFRQVPLS